MDEDLTSDDNKYEISSAKSMEEKINKLTKNKIDKKLILIIGGIVLLLIVIVLIIIFIIINANNQPEDNNNKQPDENLEIKAEIICKYEIDILDNVKILGDEFQKIPNFDIFIDGILIKYSKEYKFDKLGEHDIKYLIYDDIFNIDCIFKNISSITYVNMTSTKNAKILSLKSAFENCNNLREIIIKGFDTSKLTSTNKLFYKTNNIDLNNFEIDTSNIQDMSYMFAESAINDINFNFLNTENVKNMSHIFYKCNSLISLSLESFSTKNV